MRLKCKSANKVIFSIVTHSTVCVNVRPLKATISTKKRKKKENRSEKYIYISFWFICEKYEFCINMLINDQQSDSTFVIIILFQNLYFVLELEMY